MINDLACPYALASANVKHGEALAIAHCRVQELVLEGAFREGLAFPIGARHAGVLQFAVACPSFRVRHGGSQMCRQSGDEFSEVVFGTFRSGEGGFAGLTIADTNPQFILTYSIFLGNSVRLGTVLVGWMQIRQDGAPAYIRIWQVEHSTPESNPKLGRSGGRLLYADCDS